MAAWRILPARQYRRKTAERNMSEDSTENGNDKNEAPCRPGVDFIRARIQDDNASGRFGGRVHTRFPPEPNGCLHLGHAKSICLNFGVAGEFGGKCNLRFDDTNPAKEETEYVNSIREDVRWLGGDWQEREFYASDYFEQLYAYAEQLIRMGKAYVDDLSADEIREYRGTLTKPGRESPWRSRGMEENLNLFRRMRAGEFSDGARVLRAKIDMASSNPAMRDPTLYRIRHAEHHRTGKTWCIYPLYDYTHCLSDSLEGITHSLCTLEFVNNRELYDWVLDALNVYHPQQIEFARLNLTCTVLSKRRLIQLVESGCVSGWDDPRMPTLSGLRRRGVPPEALREFCARVGLARVNSTVEFAMLEFCIREYLNDHAPRVMAVLDPVKVVIENYPEGQVETFEMPYHPEDTAFGARNVPFSRELYIERDDFRANPPKKYHRLAPGAEVRLRYAYLITCREAVLDEAGKLKELRCVYDPQSRGGRSPDGRRVKGTIHWVSTTHALPATMRLYEQMFAVSNPGEAPESGTFLDNVNPDSLRCARGWLEPALADACVGDRVQFERLGYFCKDRESTAEMPVFNRTVTLRDSWAKLEKREG
jgi:glutaminyl-tRNA synthetase